MSTLPGRYGIRLSSRGSLPLVLRLVVGGMCLGVFPSLALAQTIVVNTLTDKADPPFNADSFCGMGTIADLPATRSLREAMIAANNTPGAQTITFAPGLSGGTINVNFDNLDADSDPNPLPGICDADTTINGDLDGNGAPDITLNGAALPAGSDGLISVNSRNTVQGLWLKNFPDLGIVVFHAMGFFSPVPQVAGNTIQGNIVEGGTVSIYVQAGSTSGFPGKVKNTEIVANLVSGAASRGIEVVTGDAAGSVLDSTTIAGNSSTSSIIGIHLLATFSAAGTNTSLTNANVTDNVVSGNSFAGIVVNPFAGDNNTLTGITLARNTATNNGTGIAVEGGLSTSNQNVLKVTIKDNIVSGNTFGGTAGIFVGGGISSSFGNHVDAKVSGNVVTDNTGTGITVLAGQDDSPWNSVSAKISGNTVERNVGYGIAAIAGLGASSFPTGTSNNNVIDAEITGNTVHDHTFRGISVEGGVGSFDGRAGAIANNNYVTATVNNNTVEDADIFGIGIFGAGPGLADSNQVHAKLVKNQACNSGMTDIQVFGGFPGDATFPPNAGKGNVAQVNIKKNTATTIAAAAGVAGNFAFLTQSKNVPCP